MKTKFFIYHYPQEATRDHLARTRGGRNLGSRQFDYSLPRLGGTIDSKRRIDVGSDDSGLLPRARMRIKKNDRRGGLVDSSTARESHENACKRFNSRIQVARDTRLLWSLSSSVVRFSRCCHFIPSTISRAGIISFSSVNIFINSQDYFIPSVLR